MKWNYGKLPKPKEGERVLCEDSDGNQFVAKAVRVANGFATTVEWANKYVDDIKYATEKWRRLENE